MNIKLLKSVMDAALGQEGFEKRQLFPKGPKIWSIPADDIIRFFWPHAYRRPWGFVYGGAVGIEIPALRQWLREHKAAEEGIFHSCFVNVLIANEDVLGDFMVEHGQPIPADLWAGLLGDRLRRVPATLDRAIKSYSRNKEELGWLAHPINRSAWDFLLEWRKNPDPLLHIPTMMPDGRIV